jgi:hypothetical protein
LKISEIGGIFAAYCEGRVNARDFVKASHCWRNLAKQSTNQIRYYRTAIRLSLLLARIFTRPRPKPDVE